MTGLNVVPLGSVAEIVMGQAPPGKDCNKEGRGTTFVKAGEFGARRPVVREWTTKPLKVARAGDVLVCVVGATAGKINESVECAIGRSVAAVRPDSRVLNSTYLFRFLQTQVQRLRTKSQGLAQGVITREMLAGMSIPVPPLFEQHSIVSVLDRADELRVKRRAAQGHFERLADAIFLETFGDPATNPKGFPQSQLGKLALKFSDGPFGSNLKSAHYTVEGVRVIRLQNIGAGDFLDDDQAFISWEHFADLEKHRCLPGDVLIGTLGDPNLRACIQPAWLKVALNKADCVQLRANREVATPEYLCALLNQPSTERMAHALVVGQTRLRISMGRLRELKVPTPPLAMQQQFATRIRAIEHQEATQRQSLAKLDELFASLQHKAFAGAL